VLFTNSVIGGSLSDSLKFPMLKQMLGITYSSVAYFALVKYTGFDLKRLFRIYLTASFWVSIWGLAEEIMRVLKFDQRFPAGPVRTLLELLGFTNLWDNHKAMSIGLYRVYSIMGEPYFLAVALLPALYSLFNCMIGPVNVRDWKEKWRFIVVLGCYLLTFPLPATPASCSAQAWWQPTGGCSISGKQESSSFPSCCLSFYPDLES